ncbi:hypothetical protein BN439_2903 [Erwinia amylovora Ea644]|nr:hypothetical protein BN439_2903 [Erwinia amylovora Ea644]
MSQYLLYVSLPPASEIYLWLFSKVNLKIGVK